MAYPLFGKALKTEQDSGPKGASMARGSWEFLPGSTGVSMYGSEIAPAVLTVHELDEKSIRERYPS